MKKSRFSKIPKCSDDELFNILEKAKFNENPNKMNLSIGMLHDEKGSLIVFESVELANKLIYESNLNKEYPQFGGSQEFTTAVQNLFFQSNSNVVNEGRVLVSQIITGGSALRISAEIVEKFITKKIHVSNHTFGPYLNIFNKMDIFYYPYFNEEKQSLDTEAFLEYLNKIDDGSFINLQLSSHNPTALDFSKEEWDKICEVMKAKKHLAQFDVAYLGYGTGSIEGDLYPIRKFSENYVEMFICYSSAKNFTNYSDDVGTLICVLNNKENIEKLKSHIIILSRSLFSFVSLYGARIIEKVLNTPELNKLRNEEQSKIYERISSIRQKVTEEIEKKGVNLNLNFLKSQSGIYMFLNLNKDQVEILAKKYSIFLCSGGRVNLSAISEDKIPYFVDSLKEILDEN